jgi:chemotaxis-related protein WspD
VETALRSQPAALDLARPDRLGKNAAGRALTLQRQVPEEYVNEATARYAEPRQAQERGTLSALVFRVGPEWLALPTALIDEVAGPCSPHSLPRRRSGALQGVVNVRGELLACVSLALLLGIGGVAASPVQSGRLLVLRQHQRRLACPVDEIDGIARYHKHELRRPPVTLDSARAYTQALLPRPQHSAGLLDDARLLRALEQSLA